MSLIQHARRERSAVVPRGASRAKPPRRPRRGEWGAFLLLTAPVLVGLGLFKYAAIGWSFLLSLSDADGTVSLGHWIGLDNYRALFADPGFRESLTTVTLYTAVVVPVTFAASLGLALLVNGVRRGRALFRTTFLLPAAVSYVAASLVWKMALFNGLPAGIANLIGGWFGMDPQAWVQTQSPPLYWVVLVTVRLWLQVGFYMVLFLAGLQGIPRDVYEAAALDGASGLRLARRITLPLLRNTSVAVLMLMLIAAFQAFDEFYNVFASASGVSAPVHPPLVYLYRTAFRDQNYGLGSAGSFVLTGLIVVVTLLQGRVVGFGRKED